MGNNFKQNKDSYLSKYSFTSVTHGKINDKLETSADLVRNFGLVSEMWKRIYNDITSVTLVKFFFKIY